MELKNLFWGSLTVVIFITYVINEMIVADNAIEDDKGNIIRYEPSKYKNILDYLKKKLKKK